MSLGKFGNSQRALRANLFAIDRVQNVVPQTVQISFDSVLVANGSQPFTLLLPANLPVFNDVIPVPQKPSAALFAPYRPPSALQRHLAQIFRQTHSLLLGLTADLSTFGLRDYEPQDLFPPLACW